MALHPTMRELTEPGPAQPMTNSPGRARWWPALCWSPPCSPCSVACSRAADRMVMLGAVLRADRRGRGPYRPGSPHRGPLRGPPGFPGQSRQPDRPAQPPPHGAASARSPESGAADDTQVALLFLDLDRFKLVNDTLGHATATNCWSRWRRLRDNVRPSDLVTRIGGDEFMILLDHFVTSRRRWTWPTGCALCLKEPFVLNGIEFTSPPASASPSPPATTPRHHRGARPRRRHRHVPGQGAGRDKVAIFD